MRPEASEFNSFVSYFFRYVFYIRGVMIGLLVLLVAGGVTISQVEGIELGKAIYFAFITGLSIGYGDITPDTAWGRVVSVAIGLIGTLFTGVTVAVATRALADSLHESRKHPARNGKREQSAEP